MVDDKPRNVRANNTWINKITPCIIALIFCIVVIIGSLLNSDKSGGWSMLGVIIFFPAFLILAIVDWLVKFIFKNRLIYIWVTELMIIGLGLWIFFTFIYI